MPLFDPARALSELPPFDRLPPALLVRAQAALDVVYAPAGERLAEAGGPALGLWIIVKGVVEEGDGAEGAILHGPGEAVDARALLQGRHPCALVVREELLAHWLPAHVFHELAAQSPPFLNFYREDLETKRRVRQQAGEGGALTMLLHTQLTELSLQPLPRLSGPLTLREAARALHGEGSKALLVKEGAQGMGLLTESDLIAALAESHDPAMPLAARRPLVALQATEDLFTALQLMLRHNIGQLVVWQADGSAGLLRQQDILSLVASHAPLLDRTIERAASIEELLAFDGHRRELVRTLHGRGVRARHVSGWVSELNAKLYAKLWSLTAPPGLVASSCLFLMGSEGRGEQMLATDQDNGLLLAQEADEALAAEAAGRLVAALQRLGLPPCPGGVMASQARWRMTLQAMLRDIARCIEQPEGEALLRLAMLADARAVAGRAELVQTLHAELHARLAAQPTVLARMARQVLAFDTPLGVFSGFVLEKGEHRGEMDLKKGGLFPIMHGVRVLALEAGIGETNTFERIERLRDLGRFDAAFARDLVGAYDFMLSLRLGAMLENIHAGRPAADSHVAPQRLDHFERDLLRDALRTVERLKRLLHHHFKLQLLS